MSIFNKRHKRVVFSSNDNRATLHKNLEFTATEQYKLLRTNLSFTIPEGKKCAVIGVTSSMRGEGKSTTAVNLSYVLAESGKRVLLIDGDLRIPSVAKKMEIASTPGLTDLLMDFENQPLNLFKSKLLNDWYILPSGDLPPNPSELLGSSRMETVLSALSDKFDFIIVDLPPVNIVSDALAISSFITGMVVVIREDYTEKKELENCFRQLKLSNVNVLGCVLNEAKNGRGTYGKYRKYYKYYRYYSSNSWWFCTMIDIHSHILPAVDDGSKDVDESLKLLDLLVSQGVELVVATPHFKANKESIDEFITRRNEAYNTLMNAYTKKEIEISLGAEVQFYDGISRMEGIEKLCIQNTNLLLLELPFGRWTEMTIKEIYELNNLRNLTIVVAHIDRYIKFQNKKVINSLLENGILFQSNPDFFNCFFTKSRAVSMLKNNEIHFLGSDCHNIISRPPQLDVTLEIIRKKCGTNFMNLLTEFSNKMLNRF